MTKILLSSVVAVFLLTGCGEDKKEASSQVVETKKEVVQKIEEQKVEPTTKEVVSQAAKDVASTLTKAASDVSNTVSIAATKVAEDTSKVMEEKMPEVKQVVDATVAKTKVVVAEVTKEATKIVEDISKTQTAPSLDGKVLFASCAGCHGQSGEKVALGKSAVIKGWDKQKVIDALNGYKNGTYGGAMKAVMKGQVATKSDAEIDALADFISKL